MAFQLDNALIRMPAEALAFSCRQQQKALLSELSAATAAFQQLGAPTATTSPQQARATVTQLAGTLRGIKRKLDEARQQQAQQLSHCRARVEHLAHGAAGSPHGSDEWRAERLDRLVADFLTRNGHNGSAAALAREAGIEPLVDSQPFLEARSILAALAHHDAAPALEWCTRRRSQLARRDSPLEGLLRLQEFIEHVRAGRRLEAVAHAREHLIQQADAKPELAADARQAMALLALGTRTRSAAHAELLHDGRWAQISLSFHKEHLALVGATQTPPLLLALAGGLIALKTPSCMSREHVALDCPTCCEPFRTLAARLPSAQRTHSTLVCKLSQALMDENNPPMVLPSGHVYARKALLELAERHGGVELRNPRTLEMVKVDELRRAYFL